MPVSIGEYEVPDVIYTDQLQSDGAAIREIPNDDLLWTIRAGHGEGDPEFRVPLSMSYDDSI